MQTSAGHWKEGLGPASWLGGEQSTHTDCLDRDCRVSLRLKGWSCRHTSGMVCVLGGSLN